MLAESRNEPLPVGEDESTAVGRILNAVRTMVSNYPFQFDRTRNVRVLDGKEEGTYDWLTVQQLVRNENTFVQSEPRRRSDPIDQEKHRLLYHLDHSWDFQSRGFPVGTMDLGGASTQLAFSMSAVESSERMRVDPNDIQTVSVFQNIKTSSSSESLFVHSFLHYGIFRAHDRFLENLIAKVDRTDAPDFKILDPCMNKRSTRQVEFEDEVYSFVGTSDPDPCIVEISALFDVYDQSLDGVFIPTFPPEMRFVAFDHASRVVDRLGMEGFFRLSELLETASTFCKLDKTHAQIINPDSDPEKLNSLCFEALYVYSLMHFGYSIPKHQAIIAFGDYLDEFELNWGLGAMVFEAHRLCTLGRL